MFPFRQSWFLFLRDTSQRSGNTTRIPSQGVNNAQNHKHNVSFSFANQTNQADGEILETFRRSARVRDEHARSVGGSEGNKLQLRSLSFSEYFQNLRLFLGC